MAQANVLHGTDASIQLPTEAAYAAILPEISGVSDDDVLPINVDLVSAVTLVLGVLPELRALRAEIIEQLPRFDVERFDKLETYALALSHAHTLHRSTFPSKAPVAELGNELVSIRDRLLTDALSLVGYQLVDGDRIKDCKKANGYRATATDVLTLVAVFKERWSELAGKTPVTLAALNDAGNRALELLTAVGVREQGPVNAGEAARMREKAFTLFSRAYDDARRVVSYLRAEPGDADDIAPSLYVGRGGRGRAGAADSKPESGVVPATSEPHSAASAVVENSAGLPVTNPFSH
jgi:hypothetical protein